MQVLGMPVGASGATTRAGATRGGLGGLGMVTLYYRERGWLGWAKLGAFRTVPAALAARDGDRQQHPGREYTMDNAGASLALWAFSTARRQAAS